MFVRNQIYQLP